MYKPLETRQGLRPVSSDEIVPTWIESLENRRLMSGSGQIHTEAAPVIAIPEGFGTFGLFSAHQTIASGHTALERAASAVSSALHNIETAVESAMRSALSTDLPRGFGGAAWGGSITTLSVMSVEGGSGIEQYAVPTVGAGLRVMAEFGFGFVRGFDGGFGNGWGKGEFGGNGFGHGGFVNDGHGNGGFADGTGSGLPDLLGNAPAAQPPTKLPSTNAAPSTDATPIPSAQTQGQTSDPVPATPSTPSTAPAPESITALFGQRAVTASQGDLEPMAVIVRNSNQAELKFALDVTDLKMATDATRRDGGDASTEQAMRAVALRAAQSAERQGNSPRRHRAYIEADEQAMLRSRPGRVFAGSTYDASTFAPTDEAMDDPVNWKQMATLIGASVLIGSYAMEVQRRKRAAMAPWTGIEAER